MQNSYKHINKTAPIEYQSVRAGIITTGAMIRISQKYCIIPL
nr:MAG TPA: hypothetical protein [Caudoviricetes sp.]